MNASQFKIWKSNVIHYINKLKKESHTIIWTDTEKASEKTQHPFLNKNSKQTRNRKEPPQPHKDHLQKPTYTRSIYLRVKDWMLPSISGIRQGFPLSPLTFNPALSFLPIHSFKKKKKKRHPDLIAKNKTVYPQMQ